MHVYMKLHTKFEAGGGMITESGEDASYMYVK